MWLPPSVCTSIFHIFQMCGSFEKCLQCLSVDMFLCCKFPLTPDTCLIEGREVYFDAIKAFQSRVNLPCSKTTKAFQKKYPNINEFFTAD